MPRIDSSTAWLRLEGDVNAAAITAAALRHQLAKVHVCLRLGTYSWWKSGEKSAEQLRPLLTLLVKDFEAALWGCLASEVALDAAACLYALQLARDLCTNPTKASIVSEMLVQADVLLFAITSHLLDAESGLGAEGAA